MKKNYSLQLKLLLKLCKNNAGGSISLSSFCTDDEVCKFLGISKSTLDSWINKPHSNQEDTN